MAKVKGSGKKKKLIINEKGSSSDDESKSEAKKSGKPCKHLKAVRPQAVKSVLEHLRQGECKDCRGKPKIPAVANNEEDSALALSVCICLKCGYQGCSRNAVNQHAHAHFLSQSSHTLCINTTTWMVWCYGCDNEISNNDENGPLQKAIKMIHDKLSKASKEDSAPTSLVSGTVKGLRNLGNTCFFNSVLQNISQTTVLVDRLETLFTTEEEVIVESEKLPKVKLTVRKTSGVGPLTSALKGFLDDFHSSSRGSLAPNKLFGEITKKSPQFRGYRQQDSQELLRYLLDGMRVEELRRIESGMKEAVKSMECSPTKEQLKDCFNNAKTFVDDVFGGSLVSTIICTQCKTKSQVNDYFLDLSLPVNTSPKQSAKSVASKFLNGKLKSEDKSSNEPEGQRERKLSKHQMKAKAKKEKKAKRGKGKMGHSPKSSKENSTVGDDDDVKQSKEEDEEDDDFDVEEDKDVVSQDGTSKLARENGDLKSPSTALKNGSKISLASNDSTEQFSIKDEAGFLVIDRISDSEKEHCQNAKQAILGGSSSKSQNSEKSSLESLVSGETESFASTRSREDVSVDELSPKEEIPLKLERGGGKTGSSSNETGVNDSSSLADVAESEQGETRKEEDMEISRSIDDIVDTLKKGLNLDEKGNDIEDEKIECEDNGGNKKEEIQMMKGEGKEMIEINQEVRQETSEAEKQEVKMEDKEEETQSVDQGEADVARENVDQVNGQQKGDENNEKQKKTQEETAKDTLEGTGKSIEGEAQADEDKAQEGTHGVTKKDIEEMNHELEKETNEAGDNIGKDTESEEKYDTDDDGTEDEDEEPNDCIDVETVGPEYICKSDECSVLSCLHQFTTKDFLEGNNKYRCDECTKRQKRDDEIKPVFTESTKQMLLWKPPLVLTLHLKRFEQIGRGLRKVNKHIEFPLELDLSPFCHKHNSVSYDVLQYNLYGIVEHSGSLHGGHYVAYVKTRTIDNKTKWYHISDSRVSEIQEEAVLRKQAYILFYHQNKR